MRYTVFGFFGCLGYRFGGVFCVGDKSPPDKNTFWEKVRVTHRDIRKARPLLFGYVA